MKSFLVAALVVRLCSGVVRVGHASLRENVRHGRIILCYWELLSSIACRRIHRHRLRGTSVNQRDGDRGHQGETRHDDRDVHGIGEA